MGYQSYENLEVWKKAVDTTVEVYRVLKECRDYGLKDQLCRASVSVPSNIAEGYERSSVKETMQYLHIAKGSSAEVRTQLLIAFRIGYISSEDYNVLSQTYTDISKMLHGLIKSRQQS